jgi:UDP-N-acetylglucosamine 3-dehydrogenase
VSLRVALLGAGEFGALHASVLAELPGAELAVVCDPDAARGQEVAGALSVPFTADADGVLADPSVDAVVVASPEVFHVPQAEAALRAGKHALVEKPVALASDDARRLAAVAQETGKVLMPGHILRFVPAYALVKEQIGVGGRVHSAFARRNVPARRFSAGHQRTHTALMSLAHDLDLLLWYLEGQSPVRVYAVERRTVPGTENPDVFWGLIEFSGGTVACVESLWTIPEGGGRYVDVELELSTDGGYITVRNPDDAVTVIDARKESHPAATVDLRAGGRRFGALREQLLHFVSRIRGTVPSVVGIEDAVRVVALAEALMLSARRGVSLDLAADGSPEIDARGGDVVADRR